MRARKPSPLLFEPDRLYSAEEVRKKIGGRTHIITIFNWAKTGVLPPLRKVGPNTSRFLGAELNERLASKD
jgi:hypothetical protein